MDSEVPKAGVGWTGGGTGTRYFASGSDGA